MKETMYFIYKSCVIAVCLCVISTSVFAQKKVSKIVKPVVSNPKISVARPPLLKAARVPSVGQRLQQNLMQGWNLVLQTQLERKALEKITQKKATVSAKAQQERQKYIIEKLQPIKTYLAVHQNNWPEYNRHPESNDLLRYIFNFIKEENPSAEVLELQREIIRLRATSNAPHPYDVIQTISSLMEYGNIVPSRATPDAQKNGKTQEEIALGEELAFAMAAAKVPMEGNPWANLPKLDRIADITNTYNAMRRQDMSSEGIPETYEGFAQIHYSNIPLLTTSEYLEEQNLFAVSHPFEYVLAPFWEQVFGRSFYGIFNGLSEQEKKAVLFTAPRLPRMIDVNSAIFLPCYSNAVKLWEEYNRREVNHYAGVEREKELVNFLTSNKPAPTDFLFRTSKGAVTFIDLSNEQQVEVLMWGWKHLQLLPSQMLERFKGDRRTYF